MLGREIKLKHLSKHCWVANGGHTYGMLFVAFRCYFWVSCPPVNPVQIRNHSKIIFIYSFLLKVTANISSNTA